MTLVIFLIRFRDLVRRIWQIRNCFSCRMLPVPTGFKPAHFCAARVLPEELLGRDKWRSGFSLVDQWLPAQIALRSWFNSAFVKAAKLNFAINYIWDLTSGTGWFVDESCSGSRFAKVGSMCLDNLGGWTSIHKRNARTSFGAAHSVRIPPRSGAFHSWIVFNFVCNLSFLLVNPTGR